ncbi:hypothetical protein [Micromonospora sp. NBC_00421]|uniref:hypothetical protein n=1 Tax=Micromonospora sp. NBC_00421 TaxID=2975976 RepID=UPI002E20A4FB
MSVNPLWSREDRINIAALNLGVRNVAVQVDDPAGGPVTVSVTSGANRAGVADAVREAFAHVDIDVAQINR